VGSLFGGKKPKGPPPLKGAAAWKARMDEQRQTWGSNPMDPLPTRTTGAIPRTVLSAFPKGS
jgi:hypothetical protein